MFGDPRFTGLFRLIVAALRPPAGARRIVLALSVGLITHMAFGLGVLAMIVAMFFGLSESFGTVPQPFVAILAANHSIAVPKIQIRTDGESAQGQGCHVADVTANRLICEHVEKQFR